MIKLIKSTFYKEKKTKKQLIDFIKEATQLSFGPQCEEFEKKFAKYQGRNHCIFFNSGSSANLAIIQALLNLGRLKRGDIIGFSAITWATNVMPLIALGLVPVPIDVELDTLNISSIQFLKTLRKYKMKAVFITNLLGFCDDIDKIKEICDRQKVLLIEDNCESLGTVYKRKKLGNFGTASTFSFYVGHHMSTIEGGAVCTDSESIASMLRLVRAHGWDRNLSVERQTKIRNRHQVNSKFYSRYTFYDLGYNLRPTEISGFLGNVQLHYLDEILRKRNKNFLILAKHIYRNNKYYPIKFDHIDFLSNFAVPIICKSQQIRDELVKECKDKIEIRPIVGGDIARQPFFRKYIKLFILEDPNARLIHEQGLYFGNNPELTKKELQEIMSVFV